MRSVLILAVVLAALAMFGPALAPHDPTAIGIPNRLAPPGAQYPLGTDAMGRCVLSRLLHGASWSLGLAFVVSVIGLVVLAEMDRDNFVPAVVRVMSGKHALSGAGLAC